MTAPLSNDLRDRVVGAIEAGESCRSVAARFGVAVSSAVKWSQRYRATGSVAPGKMGGHRKRMLEPHRAFIVERINLDQDQHGAAQRLGTERQAPAWLRTARTLAHADLPGRPAARPPHGTLRLRRTDQRRVLQGLCRAAARAGARTR